LSESFLILKLPTQLLWVEEREEAAEAAATDQLDEEGVGAGRRTKLIKKSKPLKHWKTISIPKSEKVKIAISVFLYLIAILINSWSFSTFWNITVVMCLLN
jgi:hypothetical protein